jgi:hypothetical protein
MVNRAKARSLATLGRMTDNKWPATVPFEWFLAHPDEPHQYPGRYGVVTRPSMRARFESFFTRRSIDDCWEWTGKHGPAGHGQFSIAQKYYGASRVMFFLTRGTWPLVVRHTCDNGACVNPAHLLPGTQADNLRDMVSRGRHYQQKKTHCAPANHPLSGDNLGRNATTGTRFCKACRADAQRRYRAKEHA